MLTSFLIIILILGGLFGGQSIGNTIGRGCFVMICMFIGGLILLGMLLQH